MKETKNQKEDTNVLSPVGMSLGMGIGLIGGIIFQNLPMGILIGAFLSAGFGFYKGMRILVKEMNKKRK